MNVQMAQARIKAERVGDVRAGASRLFAALDAARPEGIRYAWLLLPDGETFAALVQVDDDSENRIGDLPEYRELQEAVVDSLAEPPHSEALAVVGSYRMF